MQEIEEENICLRYTKGMWLRILWKLWKDERSGTMHDWNRRKNWKTKLWATAHTFEEEHEDFTAVLMHKDDSTNQDWNVQTDDMKTMSLTFYVLGLSWSKTESVARILFTGFNLCLGCARHLGLKWILCLWLHWKDLHELFCFSTFFCVEMFCRCLTPVFDMSS